MIILKATSFFERRIITQERFIALLIYITSDILMEFKHVNPLY
jgi:hypothetical protein